MVALRAQANKRKLDRQLKHMRGYAGLNTPGENDSEADEMMKQINSNEGSNRGTYSIAPPFQTNSLTPCLGSFSRSSLAYAARRRLWVILSSQTRQVNAKGMRKREQPELHVHWVSASQPLRARGFPV